MVCELDTKALTTPYDAIGLGIHTIKRCTNPRACGIAGIVPRYLEKLVVKDGRSGDIALGNGEGS